MSATRAAERPLGPLYGCAQIGLNAVLAALTLHLVFLYTDEFEVAPKLLAIALGLSPLFEIVLNPVVGYLSDSTTTRFGRRRPYILAAAVPYGLLFACLMSPPWGLESGAGSGFALLAATMVGLYGARAFFDVPYTALLPELTQDYAARARLAGWRQMFGTLGDILGSAGPVLLLLVLEPRDAFGWFGASVGALVVVSAAITFLGTREPRRATPAAAPALRVLLATLSSRALRIFLIGYGLAFFATEYTVGMFRFVIKYVLEAEAMLPQFIGAYFLGALVCLPLCVRAVRAYGKKPVLIFLMLANAVPVLAIFAVPASAAPVFLPIMALSGGLHVGLWSTAAGILPDVVEWEELATGSRRPGAFFGVYGVVQKSIISLSLAGVSGGLWAIGFETGGGAALGPRIRLLFGAGPALLFVAGAALFVPFPITSASYEATRRALALRGGGGSTRVS